MRFRQRVKDVESASLAATFRSRRLSESDLGSIRAAPGIPRLIEPGLEKQKERQRRPSFLDNILPKRTPTASDVSESSNGIYVATPRPYIASTAHGGESIHLDDNIGLGARLCRACLDLFAPLLQNLARRTISDRNMTILKRCCSTIRLWAHGHGVWNGNLDRVFELSKDLQQTVLSVLSHLCRALLQGTPP